MNQTHHSTGPRPSMKITVIGATGMAGAAIVGEALDRGHSVVAVSRTAHGVRTHERLVEHPLDVTGTDDLAPVLAGSDTVIVSIRLPVGDEHLLAPATTRVLDAAEAAGTRVIVIGGAAPLRSPNGPDLLVADDPVYVPTEWSAIARASLAQVRACRDHASDGWVYLSPPAVFERGPRSGSYRRGTTHLLTDARGVSRITAADLAIAVVDEVEFPRGEQHVTVAQAS